MNKEDFPVNNPQALALRKKIIDKILWRYHWSLLWPGIVIIAVVTILLTWFLSSYLGHFEMPTYIYWVISAVNLFIVINEGVKLPETLKRTRKRVEDEFDYRFYPEFTELLK